jgi:hypothetical protein
MYDAKRKAEGESAERELDARWRNRDPNRDALGELGAMLSGTPGRPK